MKIKHVQFFAAVSNNKKLTQAEKQKELYKFFKGNKALNRASVNNLAKYEAFLTAVFTEGDIPEFKRIVKIKGKRYGLEPSIQDMESGAFFDLDQLVQGDVESNLHKIIAILYRPIILKIGGKYEISSYVKERKQDKENREKLFLNEFEFKHALGVVSFFWNSTANSSHS